MIKTFKKLFYFPFAYYFRFFAKIRLARWSPYIIVVTGSSGKTTLLNLLESQIGDGAKYSHFANSSYGIPFDILGLGRKTLMPWEWFYLIFAAPIMAFAKTPSERIYIAEADCDRPGEGRFLATLLKPKITIWTNSTRTHSMNFDLLVKSGKFDSVEEAIAFEFGYFAEHSSKLAIVNGDSENIKKELYRAKAKITSISIKNLEGYKATLDGTIFDIKKKVFKFPQLLPKEIFYSLEMCVDLLEYLKIPLDKSFRKFTLPPGRNSIFKGIKNTTIIDSAYNANLDSMTAVLGMFDKIANDKKWMILGDMLEQGENEQQEHEKLAEEISKVKSDKVILMGPRVSKYTYPKLKTLALRRSGQSLELKSEDSKIISFENPNEVLEYLKSNIKGNELLLFKGARFLEGVIENLLADKKDSEKLARREKIWEKRRKSWGL